MDLSQNNTGYLLKVWTKKNGKRRVSLDKNGFVPRGQVIVADMTALEQITPTSFKFEPTLRPLYSDYDVKMRLQMRYAYALVR